MPAPDASICSAQCHPVRWNGMPKDMTKAGWQPWRLCSEACREMVSRRRGLAGSPRCRCAWEGWACGLQPACHPQHAGPRGHALHMVSQRLPEVANDIVTQLAGEPEGCLAELQGAACNLDRCGFVGGPSFLPPLLGDGIASFDGTGHIWRDFWSGEAGHFLPT